MELYNEKLHDIRIEIDKQVARHAKERHIGYYSRILTAGTHPTLEISLTAKTDNVANWTIRLFEEMDYVQMIIDITREIDEWLATVEKKEEKTEYSPTEILLGKIDFAEFGTFKDRPFLIGLQLGFKMSGSGVMDGGKYTVNISPECRWEEEERSEALVKSLEFVNDILKDAKVNYVSELVNKPVEITLENNTFKSFRILTEVL